MIKRFLPSAGLLIAVIQFFLVCAVFRQVLFQPSNFYTNNQWDGIRTMFTIQTYVEQKGPDSWKQYRYMNYPYGEHVVFAGGTPALSFFLRLMHQSGMLPANWVLSLYYWLILLFIPLSAYIFYRLGIFFFDNEVVAFLLALSLPWINYQIPRLQVGHFDLSITFFLLLNLWLLIRICRQWQEPRQQLLLWGTYVLVLVLLAYIHLYLAAIIAVFTSVFCIVFGFMNRKAITSNALSALNGAFFSGAAFTLILFLFAFTDPVLKERKPIPEGYNYVLWNAQFSATFTPSHGEKIKFPLLSNGSISYENDTYLGGFALYGMIVLGIAWLFCRRSAVRFPFSLSGEIGFRGRVLIAVCLSALCSLLISFGEEFYLLNGEFILRNYLSPFLWLKKVYAGIQQFRVLARFNFYFFWAANIAVAYMLIRVFWNFIWGKALIAILLLFSLSDLKDRISYIGENIRPDNFVHRIEGKIPAIDYRQYQAILPIPTYLVGSEDYNITIDPEDNWNTFTYYLAYHSRLPLMASKMPRTSMTQAKAQISLFLGQPDSSLLSILRRQAKPVLVVYNPALPRVSIGTERQPAQYVNENFGKFLEQEAPRLKKITVHNGLEYYTWTPGE